MFTSQADPFSGRLFSCPPTVLFFSPAAGAIHCQRVSTRFARIIDFLASKGAHPSGRVRSLHLQFYEPVCSRADIYHSSRPHVPHIPPFFSGSTCEVPRQNGCCRIGTAKESHPCFALLLPAPSMARGANPFATSIFAVLTRVPSSKNVEYEDIGPTYIAKCPPRGKPVKTNCKSLNERAQIKDARLDA